MDIDNLSAYERGLLMKKKSDFLLVSILIPIFATDKKQVNKYE